MCTLPKMLDKYKFLVYSNKSTPKPQPARKEELCYKSQRHSRLSAVPAAQKADRGMSEPENSAGDMTSKYSADESAPRFG